MPSQDSFLLLDMSKESRTVPIFQVKPCSSSRAARSLVMVIGPFLGGPLTWCSFWPPSFLSLLSHPLPQSRVFPKLPAR